MDATELIPQLRALATGIAAMANDDKLEADCERLLAKEQTAEVLSHLVGRVDVLVAVEDGPDEMMLNALLLQISHQGEAEKDRLIPAFLESLKSHTSGDAAPSIGSVIGKLFNILPQQSKHRYDALYQLLECGVSAELAQQVEESLERWIEEWQLSQHQQRALFKLLATQLKDADQTALSKKYLTRYVKSFNGAPASELMEAAQDARDLIAQALSTSTADTLDLMKMDAVQQLKEEAGFQLLQALANGDVAAYEAVCNKHASVFSDLGLDKPEVDKRVQLMALAKLCAKKQQVTFAEVASGLNISEQSVEQLVIDALRQSVLEATIDDVQKVITVTRVVYDSFEADDWKGLQGKLQAWKNNIEQVRKTLDQVKLQVTEKQQQSRRRGYGRKP